MGYSDRKEGTMLGQNSYVTFCCSKLLFSTFLSSFYFTVSSENWKVFWCWKLLTAEGHRGVGSRAPSKDSCCWAYVAGYPETSGTLISKGNSSWPVTQYSAVPVWDSLGFQSFLQVSLACTTRMCAMTVPWGQPNGNWVSLFSLRPCFSASWHIWSDVLVLQPANSGITCRSLKRLQGLGLSVQPHPQGQSWGTWAWGQLSFPKYRWLL